MLFHWINWLRQHFVLKCMFYLLPTIFCSISCFAYTYELLKIYQVISVNDVTVKEGIATKVVVPVEFLDETTVHVLTDELLETRASEDGFVGYLKTGSTAGDFVFQVGFGEVTSHNLDFISSVADDEGLVITISDKDFTSDFDTTIGAIYQTDDAFELRLSNGEVAEISDSNNILVDEDRVKLTTEFNTTVDKTSAVIVSALPSDDYYYDIESNVLLKSAGKDFLNNYILGSNILVTIVSIILLTTMMHLFDKRFNLIGDGMKHLFVINVFSCLMIVLVLCLAVILLG